MALPLPAAAQVRVRLEPFFGVYEALQASIEQGVDTLTQAFATAVGARVAIWPSERVGIELGGSYAPSYVTAGVSNVRGNLKIGSLRMLYALTQGTRSCLSTVGGCQPLVYVAGGLGWIKRGGDAWKGVSGLGSLTASVGGGMRIPLSPRLSARIDGELFLYSVAFTAPSLGQTASRFQQDIVVTGGLDIPLFTIR